MGHGRQNKGELTSDINCFQRGKFDHFKFVLKSSSFHRTWHTCRSISYAMIRVIAFTIVVIC